MSTEDTVTGQPCPPGITWYNRMQALFEPYVQCMIGNGIDLSKYNGSDGDSVVENIEEIKKRIDNGSMPRGAQYQATWKAANGKFYFDCWYQQGYPEGTQGADAQTTAEAGAGPAITWTNTMQAVFAPYVECMQNFGINLGLYNGSDGDSVVENIEEIKARIDNGSMPRGAQYQATWKAANGKALFDQWYAETPPYPE
jgi:hypothetical protein